MSSGEIFLLLFNLALFGLVLVAWRLWRQSVPKRRKLSSSDASDWQSSVPAAQAQVPAAMAVQAPALVAGAPMGSAHNVPDLDFADSAPLPQGISSEISDADLARLLDGAPATSSVQPLPAQPAQPVIDHDVTFDPAAPVAPVANGSFAAAAPSPTPAPTGHTSLFAGSSFDTPASSMAPSPIPPVVAQAHSNGNGMGNDVAGQVSTLLAAPAAPAAAASSASLFAPNAAATTVVGTSDHLRLDVTGRSVADLMRSLSARLATMGYQSRIEPAGEAIFERGAESIRVSVSSNQTSPLGADGKPVPGRADIVVVGGQLQETTEAVLFELLDNEFQLRWAVAGELVLSSPDGALARVNVNPAESA